MTQNTSKWGLPYPEGTDPADVPSDVEALAESLDGAISILMGSQGLTADLPDPGDSIQGQIYWSTNGQVYYYFDGTDWQSIGPSTVGTGAVGTTQLADASVTAVKLASNAVTTSKVADANITTGKLADAAVTTVKIADANVTKAKLDAAVLPSGTAADTDEALRALGSSSGNAAAGNDVRITSAFSGTRLAVRSVVRSNVSTSSAPSTMNGITPSNGDRFLLVAQSTASQNGIWTWSSAGAALTRATDMNSSAHLTRGVQIFAAEGTAGIDAETVWVLTSSGSLTLGSSSLAFQAVNYSGYGSSSNRPSASLIAAGGTYYNTTTTEIEYSDGSSAWSATPHAGTHTHGATDEIDGDELDIDYSPTNYTSTTGTPGTNSQSLTAHLRGVDAVLGGVSHYAAGSVNGTAIADDVNAATRILLTGSMPLAMADGTWMYIPSQGTGVSSLSTGLNGIQAIYLKASDFSISGKTTKLRTRATMGNAGSSVNKPGFTVGLYPVSPIWTGSAGVTYLGTVVSGSTAAIAQAAVSSDGTSSVTSTSFTFPSDGWYVMAAVVSNAVSGSTLGAVHFSLELFYA